MPQLCGTGGEACVACPADQVCEQGKCQATPEVCPAGGCPKGSYCDLNQNRCVVGCVDQGGCSPGYQCTASHQCALCAWDADKDGHYAPGSCLWPADDCNDKNAKVSPGSPESCDGLDNNCDGQVDEGVTQRYYADADQDGWGGSSTVDACSKPSGFVSKPGDCDDKNGLVHPGAAEACDGVDNDCNGKIDDGLVAPACAKTSGVCAGSHKLCGGAAGWSACTASDYGASYEAKETSCDGKDNDCDGVTDQMTRPCAAEHVGVCAAGQETCVVGSWQGCAKPTAEQCDGKDNDCDGKVDESLVAPDCPLTLGVCASAKYNRTCLGASGWSPCDASVYGPKYEPVEQTCDAVDNDCDGLLNDVPPRSCAAQHLGVCAVGTESCGVTGKWQGCATPTMELCGSGLDEDCDGLTDDLGSVLGSAGKVGSGRLPRLVAVGSEYVAAWVTSSETLTLQRLDAVGKALGGATVQPHVMTGAVIKAVDLTVYDGGLVLSWVEDPPFSASLDDTYTFYRVFDASLTPLASAVVLPADKYDYPEDLRVAPASGGKAFVVLQRVFYSYYNVGSGEYGTQHRFMQVSNPSAPPASWTELSKKSHGSQPQGSALSISVATLPDGFAVGWGMNMISVYSGSGSKLWGPKAPSSSSFGPLSLTYDGTHVVVAVMGGSSINSNYIQKFDPATGAALPVVPFAPFTAYYAPYAGTGLYVDKTHVHLAEEQDASYWSYKGGDYFLAVFDASGKMQGKVNLVADRAPGDCDGQCARMAATASTMAVFYENSGDLFFQPVCR